jgi:hypothetical protein
MSVWSSIPRLSRVRCSTQPSVEIRTPSMTSGFSPLASAEIHKKSLRDAVVAAADWVSAHVVAPDPTSTTRPQPCVSSSESSSEP